MLKFYGGLVTNGKDFFDLMTRQMRGIHDGYKEQQEGEYAECDAKYSEAIKAVYDACADRKKVDALGDAVGSYLSCLQDEEYKHGFADAICMMLQATARGK